MRPGLPPGRIVIAVRQSHMPRVGDVVIVSHDGGEQVKRVRSTRGAQIYVLGDDPDNSTDSRSFGWLPLSAIQGTVLWPRTTQHYRSPGAPLPKSSSI
jgi:hypothetical protein